VDMFLDSLGSARAPKVVCRTWRQGVSNDKKLTMILQGHTHLQAASSGTGVLPAGHPPSQLHSASWNSMSVLTVLGERRSSLTGRNDPLILHGLVYMLLTVSKAVIVSVCTSLIAIGFGASAQLLSRDLLFGHGGGGGEEVA